MLKLADTIDPHLGEHILFSGAEITQADKVMIMIHGRGATAESMTGLIEEFKTANVLYVIPQAHNLTWYPFRFIENRAANEPGISSGLALIAAIIKALSENGFEKQNIFLFGFSQGACLALDYAAHNPDKFGGVFALSGGLIGDNINETDYQGNLERTPVFLGCSNDDFHIPEKRVYESAIIFEKLNAHVTKRIYPGLGHSINKDEIDFIEHQLK